MLHAEPEAVDDGGPDDSKVLGSAYDENRVDCGLDNSYTLGLCT